MTGAAQRAGFWGVLALRDFRLLWTGDAVSGIGNGVTTVVLPLIALRELDASSFQIGVLASAVWLPWLIVGLPAGAWIDRLPRRPIMMIANAACALFFASIAIAGFLEAMTYGHLLLVALLTGTATVFFQAAYHSYLPTVLAEADLVEGNSKIQGAEAATRVIGPSVGGLVVATVGLAAGLVVDAFTFAFCFVCIWLIRVQETVHRGQNQREPLRRQIALGLRFVAGDPYLRSIVVYGTLLNFGLTGYSTIQIVFLEKTVGVGEFGLGLLLAIAGVGGIVGSMIARPLGRRFGTARSVLTCQLVTGPFILLAPLTTYGAGLFWFCIGGMVMVAGVVSCNVGARQFPSKLLSAGPPRTSGGNEYVPAAQQHSARCSDGRLPRRRSGTARDDVDHGLPDRAVRIGPALQPAPRDPRSTESACSPTAVEDYCGRAAAASSLRIAMRRVASMNSDTAKPKSAPNWSCVNR